MSRAQALLLLDTLRLHAPAPPGADQWGWAPVGLAALAEQQGASLWLLRRLSDLGLLPSVSPDVAGPLRAAAAREAAYNGLVDAEAEHIAALLDQLGVPSVFIKGSARRAVASRVPYADARLTRDVDLLVPAERAQPIWDRLMERGYRRASTWEPDEGRHYHLPALLSPGGVGVELHVSTSLQLSAGEAWKRFRDSSRDIEWRGRRVAVPCDTELLSEALRHAMVEGAAGYRLRYILDAAVLLDAPDVAWNEIERRMAAGELGDSWRVRHWLGAARRMTMQAADGPAFPLENALAWRLAVGRRLATLPRVCETAAEAAIRMEAGLPPWRSHDGRGGRGRRLVERLARAAYAGWRASSARRMASTRSAGR